MTFQKRSVAWHTATLLILCLLTIPIRAVGQSTDRSSEAEHQALNSKDADDIAANLRAWQTRIAASCGVTLPNPGELFSKEQTAAWSNCFSKNTASQGVPDPSYDSSRVKVLYSIDDQVCTTVANLYTALGRRKDSQHPPGHWPWSGWFWEIRYAAEFRKVGLVEPPPLRDHGFNPGIHEHGGWYGFNAAYKLKLGDGLPPQIVWISDAPWHDEVSTNVVVFKPGKDFDAKFWAQPRSVGTLSDEGAEQSIELGVLFDEQEPYDEAFRYYQLPYLFRDGNTMARYQRVDGKGRRSGPQTYIYLGAATNVIQRVYNFHGHPIFIAQEGNGWRAVVYRLKDGQTKEDICYLGTLLGTRG